MLMCWQVENTDGWRVGGWRGGRWAEEKCVVAKQRGSFRAFSRVVSMSGLSVCASSLCGRVSMGQSGGSHGGSCHGNRGCRLVPQDLSCPTVL